MYMIGSKEKAMFRSTLTAMALVLGISGTAEAAKLGSFLNNEGKVVLTLEGEIKEGDSKGLQSMIDKAKSANREVIALRLNSPGGNMVEGIHIADVVNDNNLATVVVNNTWCASACFLAFAAGHGKYASARSSLGVHGAADQSGKETVDSRDATVVMAKILNMMHVPHRIIGEMVITPPDQMVWLKMEEMKEWDVVVTGLPKKGQ